MAPEKTTEAHIHRYKNKKSTGDKKQPVKTASNRQTDRQRERGRGREKQTDRKTDRDRQQD